MRVNITLALLNLILGCTNLWLYFHYDDCLSCAFLALVSFACFGMGLINIVEEI